MEQGANISQGIGSGLAQVISTNKLDSAVWKAAEARKNNQKVEKEKLFEDLAKVNVDGIKIADTDKINELQNQVLEKYSTLNSSKDRATKQRSKIEMEQAKNQLLIAIQRSKQANQFDADLKKMAYEKWEDYDDETRIKIQNNANLSSFDPNYKMDYIEFLPQAKDVDMASYYDKIAKRSYGEPKMVITPDASGRDITEEKQSYDPVKEQVNFKLDFTNDRKFRNNIVKRFSTLDEETQKQFGSSPEAFGFAEYLASRPNPKSDLGVDSKNVTNIYNSTESGNTLPASPTGSAKINIKTYNPAGGISSQNTTATSLGGFRFNPVNLQAVNSSDIIDMETLKPNSDVGVTKISVGDMQVLPVYKKGAKFKNGKKADGLVISDEQLQDAINKGVVVYDVVGFGAKEDGTPIQVNARNVVEKAQYLGEGGEKDKAALSGYLKSLTDQVATENASLNKKKTKAPAKAPNNVPVKPKGKKATGTKNIPGYN